MAHDHTGTEDCSDFLERIIRMIDDELEEGDCAVVREHLESCNPCLESYDLQRTVKMLVARSCAETAPAELRERVRVSIHSVQAQINEENG